MHAGEIFLILILNCILIFILYYFQKRLIKKNIMHLKEEVRELEDLVAAIIEEFEDIADNNASKAQPGEILSSNQELNLNYPTVGDILDNMKENDFNETALAVEASPIPPNQVNRMNDGMENTTVNSWNENDERVDDGETDSIQTVASMTVGIGTQEPEGASVEGSLISLKPEATIQLESIHDSRHRRILELRQQGITIEDIARQLKTGRGEIQLVLGLYRRS